MKLQLALDRLNIDESIEIASLVEESIDWIEVGTSLIKEFGMDSIYKMKQAFPNKSIVADMKTMDNAKYEFDMCYSAGADVATVMGVAPEVTIQTCLDKASEYNKKVMIDLLNTSEKQQRSLLQYQQAIFCRHISKDEQEINRKSNPMSNSIITLKQHPIEVAVAGGITLKDMEELQRRDVSVVIIGSAITKANAPAKVASEFKKFTMMGV